MKGSPAVLKVLTDVLTAEMTAINQYVLHASICKDQGLQKLGKKIYDESIDEMRHAQLLIDRILFLEDIPNLQRLFPLNIGRTVKEQFDSDMALEQKAIERLRDGIAICRQEGDITSAVMLEEILKSEEEHLDWIESQLELIDQVGMENYLAQQIHP